jgi:hypothetical protein
MGSRSRNMKGSFFSSELILAYTPFEELSHLNGYIYSEKGVLIRARDIVHANATNISYLNQGSEWVFKGDIIKIRDKISPYENEGWIISIFTSRLKHLENITSLLSLPFDLSKVYTSHSRGDKLNFLLNS